MRLHVKDEMTLFLCLKFSERLTTGGPEQQVILERRKLGSHLVFVC